MGTGKLCKDPWFLVDSSQSFYHGQALNSEDDHYGHGGHGQGGNGLTASSKTDLQNDHGQERVDAARQLGDGRNFRVDEP